MNPALPVKVIERAERLDPVSAATEYGAEFRDDADSYISADIVDQAIMTGVTRVPPMFDVA